MREISILLVDDENFVCENIKLKINRLTHDVKYNITSCNSGNQALLLAKSEKFDIIFTDIRMPFMGGLCLIKELRQVGFEGEIWVVSGFDDFDYVRESFLNGANDYILKPVEIAQLNKLLAAFIANEHKGEENSATQAVDGDNDVEQIHDVIEYAENYILKHFADESLDMAAVASHISLSYSHFSNLFRTKTDMTFPTYLLKVRIEKAVELLADPSLKIADICYKVGFKYPQQFSRDFKKVIGVYPKEYQRQNNLM